MFQQNDLIIMGWKLYMQLFEISYFVPFFLQTRLKVCNSMGWWLFQSSPTKIWNKNLIYHVFFLRCIFHTIPS